MSIPPSGEMKPMILKYLARTKDPIKVAVLAEIVAKHFGITAEEQEERIPSGVKKFTHRVALAAANLKKIGLLQSPRHSYVQLTVKGHESVNSLLHGSSLHDIPPEIFAIFKDDGALEPYKAAVEKINKVKKLHESKLPDPHDNGGEKFFIQMATEIVKAHLSKTAVRTEDLPKLIKKTYETLRGMEPHQSSSAPEASTSQEPAVPIEESVAEDHITCLECGLKFTSLKRHIKTHHYMSLEQYREKWGLPLDYPMVASSYAAIRSRIAKKIGLGGKVGTRQKHTPDGFEKIPEANSRKSKSQTKEGKHDKETTP